MKFSKPFILLSILLVTLIVATFVGANFQEGISQNNLVALKSILDSTTAENESVSMESIRQMNVDDPDFANIINSETMPDSLKISKLQSLVGLFGVDNMDVEIKLQDVLASSA